MSFVCAGPDSSALFEYAFGWDHFILISCRSVDTNGIGIRIYLPNGTVIVEIDKMMILTVEIEILRLRVLGGDQ